MKFVYERKLCIVNGRTDDCFNNYACVSNKGRSVVDYIITDHGTIQKLNNFKEEACVELVNKLKLKHLISEISRLPAHSVLEVEFSTSLISESSIQKNKCKPDQAKNRN